MFHSQLDLFTHVASAYAEAAGGALDNSGLYSALMDRLGVPAEVANAKVPVGTAGQAHSLWKRRVRFTQQSLKHMGIIERRGRTRGVWTLTEAAGKRLNKAAREVKLVAFSTKLGLCMWGSNSDGLSGLDEPISLIVTSPPFPLQKPRAYGNPSQSEYVEWMVRSLEPVMNRLAPGACIALQISNDVFEPGSPTRSLYRERVVIALHDKLGLYKLDEIIWLNKSKPPGPVQWASIKRFQLNTAYEVVYVFTNDPSRCKADNRRVLEVHSRRHKALMAAGGEARTTCYGDGAYRLREGSYRVETEGKIPRNVLDIGHRCADTLAVRRHADALGLPAHGAMMPTRLPDFLIRYLSEPGDLVLDLWSGSGKTGLAAERLGRRWLMFELILEYARTSAEMFRGFDGFCLNPLLAGVGNAA